MRPHYRGLTSDSRCSVADDIEADDNTKVRRVDVCKHSNTYVMKPETCYFSADMVCFVT